MYNCIIMYYMFLDPTHPLSDAFLTSPGKKVQYILRSTIVVVPAFSVSLVFFWNHPFRTGVSRLHPRSGISNKQGDSACSTGMVVPVSIAARIVIAINCS